MTPTRRMSGANPDTGPAVRLIRYGPFRAPVRFDDCDDLIAGFRTLLAGWDVAEVPASMAPAPIIRFRKRGGRYFWTSRRVPPPRDWTPRGPRLTMHAVADFHYQFLAWYALEFPDQFCLHCAAVEMNGALVILPNVKKTGKSTLVCELAARGYRVFCDDVLAIEATTGDGIGLGIMPRVRLPLPDTLSPRHRQFVTARMGLRDDHAAYVLLRGAEIAPFGTRCPVRAVILPDRHDPPGAAELTAANRAQALSKMIDRNFARHLSAPAIFDNLLAIVDRAELRSLRFSNAAEAADLLEGAFAAQA